MRKTFKTYFGFAGSLLIIQEEIYRDLKLDSKNSFQKVETQALHARSRPRF